jgi:hypothetical protein
MRVLLFSTTETILLCGIFPFAQRIFSIVRRWDIRGSFLKKFERFRQLRLAVSGEKTGWERTLTGAAAKLRERMKKLAL